MAVIAEGMVPVVERPCSSYGKNLYKKGSLRSSVDSPRVSEGLLTPKRGDALRQSQDYRILIAHMHLFATSTTISTILSLLSSHSLNT